MKSKDTSINVHDQELMIELGIHPKRFIPCEPNERTSKEEKALRSLRRTCRLSDPHFRTSYPSSIPIKANLIMYLKKNNKYPNTTYSIKCLQHEISNILNFYSNKQGSIVDKYVYNGKTYRSHERPFWYGNR